MPKGKVLPEALSWANAIVRDSSPDAVQSTKRGILLAWQYSDVEEATVKHALSPESVRHYDGENIKVCLESDALLKHDLSRLNPMTFPMLELF